MSEYTNLLVARKSSHIFKWFDRNGSRRLVILVRVLLIEEINNGEEVEGLGVVLLSSCQTFLSCRKGDDLTSDRS